jgi:hypothetical protein
MCQADDNTSGDPVSEPSVPLHLSAELAALGVEALIALHRVDAENWDAKFGIKTKRSEFHRNTADTLTALLAERDALREAVEPVRGEFAGYAAMFKTIPDDEADRHMLEVSFTLGDIRSFLALITKGTE